MADSDDDFHLPNLNYTPIPSQKKIVKHKFNPPVTKKPAVSTGIKKTFFELPQNKFLSIKGSGGPKIVNDGAKELPISKKKSINIKKHSDTVGAGRKFCFGTPKPGTSKESKSSFESSEANVVLSAAMPKMSSRRLKPPSEQCRTGSGSLHVRQPRPEAAHVMSVVAGTKTKQMLGIIDPCGGGSVGLSTSRSGGTCCEPGPRMPSSDSEDYDDSDVDPDYEVSSCGTSGEEKSIASPAPDLDRMSLLKTLKRARPKAFGEDVSKKYIKFRKTSDQSVSKEKRVPPGQVLREDLNWKRMQLSTARKDELGIKAGKVKLGFRKSHAHKSEPSDGTGSGSGSDSGPDVSHRNTSGVREPSLPSREPSVPAPQKSISPVRSDTTSSGKQGVKPISKCFKCAKVFKNLKSRHKHEKKCGQTIIVCNICQNKFKSVRYLKRHVKNMHKDPKYQCDNLGCEMRFLTHAKLKAHIKNHNAKCDICEKSFKNRGSLKSHKYKCHSNIKRSKTVWKCPICPHTFGSDRGLRYHVLVHKAGEQDQVHEVASEGVQENEIVRKEIGDVEEGDGSPALFYVEEPNVDIVEVDEADILEETLIDNVVIL